MATLHTENDFTVIFDTKKAGEEYIAIKKLLSEPDVKLPRLLYHVDRLQKLHNQAELCIKQSEGHLKDVIQLIQGTKIEQALLIKQPEYKYLQEKKMFYAKQLSECQFYIYRSKQALVKYKEQITVLSASKLFARQTPIWSLMKKTFWSDVGQINLQNFDYTLGMRHLSLAKWIVGVLLIGFGLLFSYFVRRFCQNWMETNTDHPSQYFTVVTVLNVYIMPVVIFGLLSFILNIYTINVVPTPAIVSVIYSAFLFMVVWVLFAILFNPPTPAEPILQLTEGVRHALYYRSLILFGSVLSGFVVYVITLNMNIATPVQELSRTIYMTVLSGLIVWLAWTICMIPNLESKYHTVLLSTKILLAVFLFATVVTEWLGYHHFVIFVVTAILSTVLLSYLVATLWILLNKSYMYLDDPRYSTARAFKQMLGVRVYRSLNELYLFKLILQITLITFFIIAAMKIWAISPNIIDSVGDAVLKGFTFAEHQIIPAQIVLAVILFSFIVIGGRFLATTVAKREQFEGETETQVAVASIITYVAFLFALVIALIVVGVNFTGLAIIAGALSVGIGLGLQNIVNNFVSGIILLLEKPIKPGDRIIVGTTEGFVKKIRLRATQITTLAKEDVMVPNADLITNQVTNYMFRNRNWRVVCQVGVAYGSDVGKVKEVLLGIATKHPDILQDPQNQPSVLFRSFGDSSLVFELWCIIQDVNKKFIIASELNFAIDAAFREASIVIAFPQRDIHIIRPKK